MAEPAQWTPLVALVFSFSGLLFGFYRFVVDRADKRRAFDDDVKRRLTRLEAIEEKRDKS